MEKYITKELKSLNEKYIYAKHKSGLDIILVPKDVKTSYAIFATKYGAIDNCFKTNLDDDYITVPDGIAHYLEHKMFENEDGSDTSSKFAQNGAYDNAFTSTDVTAYHFQCTNNFEKNLEILLDYVSHPYYTDENVEKERGIIGEEIGMGDDNPGRNLYYGLLDSLYQKSQIKLNVLGTIESISKITPKLLYSCYNTFYNPSNMTLFVYGNHNMDGIIDICDKVLPKKDQITITRKYNEEPYELNQKKVVKYFEVSRPIFRIGIKDTNIPSSAKERLKKDITADLLYDLLFGETSEFYIKTYEEGKIDRLSCGFDSSPIHSYGYIGGESDNPDEMYDMFISYVEKKKKEGFKQEDFERIKRVIYSSMVKAFDSPRILDELLDFKFSGFDVFDFIEQFNYITLNDVMSLFNKQFKEDRYGMVVIMPIQKRE